MLKEPVDRPLNKMFAAFNENPTATIPPQKTRHGNPATSILPSYMESYIKDHLAAPLLVAPRFLINALYEVYESVNWDDSFVDFEALE